MFRLREITDLSNVRSALLGLLVCWQLTFIPLSNLVDAFPHRTMTFDELSELREVYPEQRVESPLIDLAATATDAWSRLTGQYQMWWLFAPQFPSQAVFPAVALRWDAGADAPPIHPPVLLRSAHDPADPGSYVRVPSSLDRLFHYEVRLASPLAYWKEADVAPDQMEGWRQFFRDCVRRQSKSISAYLRWRLRTWQAEHVGVPSPSELILSVRIYPTNSQANRTAMRGEPSEVPLARLPLNASDPTSDIQADAARLEVYDPFAKLFIPVARDGEPDGTEQDDE
ncbi:MAG: hypothetical protein C0483_17110 [Pirellula sp.]|nr:hypothetical protein [Pirellula sp.]